MIIYLLKRIAGAAVVLWAIITITFGLMHAIPGGPFTQEKKLPPAVMENIEARYHLNDPLWKQYADYVSRAAVLDLGPSYKYPGRTVNDIRNYLFMFQGFSQDLMMCVGTLMKWKFRMPSIFKKTLYQLTAKTVNDILTRYEWKDDAVRKTCGNIRKYQHTLGYSAQWMSEYAFNIVMLAKKEPKPKNDD